MYYSSYIYIITKSSGEQSCRGSATTEIINGFSAITNAHSRLL
jgi:precorrin-2 methylase